MLQATKNKYTVETLKPLNILYDHEHWLTQQDVDMANGYVELIERTRSEKTPQIGDRLIYVDRYGKYYGNALIENNDEESGRISICEEPYIPFVWEQDANIRLSVSGGAWKSHATLTPLAKQDLPTFGYNMIALLKSWCWGSILFYPFKISRFS